MAHYKNDSIVTELNTDNLDLKTNYDVNFKTNNLLRGKNIVLLFELSDELQTFIDEESKKGNITRYKTPAGIGIDKNELERLITQQSKVPSQPTIDLTGLDDDPANNFYFKSLAELRTNRIDTRNFVKRKGKDKLKYVDIRIVLKQSIKQMAKVLGCEQNEILKQIEPILELQFRKRKLEGEKRKW